MKRILRIKGKPLFMVWALGFAVVGGGHSGSAETAQPFLAANEPPGAAIDQANGPAKKELPIATDLYGDQLPDGAVGRLGTVRFNHGDRLKSLFFLPDAKTLVSEGYGKIRLWDAATGKELREFSTVKPANGDHSVLSPDGRFLSLLDQENEGDTVRIWDLVQGKEVRVVQLPVRRGVWDVWHRNDLSPDGVLCAVNMPKQIQVFDIATTKELFKLPNNEGNQGKAVVFAGNDQLVTADKKQVVQVWAARTGKPIREFNHGSPVEFLAASVDGLRLATLEHHTYAIDRFLDKDLVHVWDLTTGTQLHALAARPQRWYMRLGFSPDGKIVFAGSSGMERGIEWTAWDAATGNKVRELNGGYPLAVSPDGSNIAVGFNKFNLVDLKTGRPAAFAETRHAWAKEVFLSPAGDRAFTIGHSSVGEWNATTGQALHIAPVPYFDSSLPRPKHSPDGRYASVFEGDYKDLQIIIWDVVGRKPLHTLRPPGADAGIKTAFSPTSSMFATYQPWKDALIRIWDVGTGKELRSFKGTKANWDEALYFSGDGKTLTLAGRDVVGFDIASGKELYSWRMIPHKGGIPSKKAVEGGGAIKQEGPSAWRALAISPDVTIAAGILTGGYSIRDRTDKRIVLCDAKTGRVLGRMDDSGIASPGWESVSFSPDSRLLATSDRDTVHLWEVATRREMRALRGHRGELSSLSFSADGRRLASSSTDSTCLIWDLVLAAGAAKPLAKEPGEIEMTAWWADLAGEDPRRGYAAIWRLAETPKLSVSFLGQRLSPVTQSQVKQISQHITGLGSETFAVRQKAFQQLNFLGRPIEAALRRALEQNPALEVRLRLDQLLNNLNNGPTSGEPLRIVRALAVLEHVGTPEARRLLQALAQGAPGAWLTTEASAAWARLALRAD